MNLLAEPFSVEPVAKVVTQSTGEIKSGGRFSTVSEIAFRSTFVN